MLIHNSILDKQADLICITKTSVEEMKRTSLFTICLPNFIIQYQPRLNVREGEGGITVINRSEISLTRCLSSTLRVLSVFTWDWVTKTGWDSFWSTGPPHPTPPPRANSFPARVVRFGLRCGAGASQDGGLSWVTNIHTKALQNSL